MSRWGKSRPQSYTLPLDALVKEKENTNRPVAARSAGTVGKWGITSFTSIRARPIYGFASFSPNQDASFQHPNISPKSLLDGSQLSTSVQQTPENNVIAKPKKFFKSRNSVPDTDIAIAALADPHAAAIATPSNVTKLYANAAPNNVGTSSANTKLIQKQKFQKLVKPEKQIKPEKASKALKKKSKIIEKASKVVEPPKPKPTRILSRTRKTVNYSEEKSRSPSPKPHASAAPQIINISPNQQPSANIIECENNIPLESQSKHLTSDTNPIVASPTKNLAIEHPPIVLRISKGTSRLVSTDSEGINSSPPYLSPIQQVQIPNPQYSTAASSLVAILSDDPPLDTLNQNTCIDNTDIALPITPKSTPKSKSKPKAEPIKLKIKKTNAAKSKSSNDLSSNQETGKSTRSSRRQQQQLVDEPVSSVLQPGTANYELYQTLTTPPQDKEFDSQSLILDSSRSIVETTAVEKHSPVDHKQTPCGQATDLDTSQSSSLVAPPSDIGSRLASMQDSDTENNEQLEKTEIIAKSSVVPKRRGAKNQSQANSSIEEPTQKKPRNRKIRPESSVPLPTVQPDKIVRKRITAAAKKQYKDSESDSQLNHIQEHTETPLSIPENNTEEQFTNQINKTKKGRKKATPSQKETIIVQEQPVQASSRVVRATRNNTNSNMMQDKERDMVIPPVTRSYGRKRKQPTNDNSSTEPTNNIAVKSTNDSSLLLPDSGPNNARNNINISLPFIDHELTERCAEAKIPKTRAKRQNQGNHNGNDQLKASNNNEIITSPLKTDLVSRNDEDPDTDPEKPSVKLVISKKKGSIFKSRAIDVDSGENKKQKRHVYKHKWDDDLSEEKTQVTETKNVAADEDAYADGFDDVNIGKNSVIVGSHTGVPSKFLRATRSNVPDDDLRIRNVKKAHQMQEIGEFQEMDDDVEYILESLKSQNPIATRSLAAIQLASKCMTPAFRMHVRAHGTATKFFSALHDATQNQSLGLCTATIMFVLIQDNLNMDLDKHSLELMLNLLDSDITHKNNYKESGLTDEQSQRNVQKVIEICREIKGQGKAIHLNLDNISIGTLAMETLLTLTSKRAGEWFKDELRTLGGLEHIINTICECCKQISDYVVDWTEVLLEKLRKIERCLRVLENVSERNEDNQKYILFYKDGHAVETLVNFYKLCDSEIALYPTNEITPTENPGVVLREALVPTLKVLINLTHTFNNKPLGSVVFGEKPLIFDTSLHLLLQAPNYVPEKCIFELSLLVLLLLINLTVHSVPNRIIIMEASAPSDFGNQFVKVPAIKALIEYFYKYEELARFVEQNTDDILNNQNNPEKQDKTKLKSQEEIEETVSTLLQKAGNHMEHTMLASYVCLLVGHLVMDCGKHELSIRKCLRDESFEPMVQILEKYYNFMNLTASSEAIQVAHIKETKRIIQYLKNSDLHSTKDNENQTEVNVTTNLLYKPAPISTTTAQPKFSNDDYSSSSRTTNSSNNMFNKVYFSGR